MANLGEYFSPDVLCVFVETNLNTRLAVLVHKDDTISHLKGSLRKEHDKCFPEVGEIKMTAFKVERRNHLYHISDSMIVSKVFEGIRSDCYAYVDAVRVEKADDQIHLKKKNSNDTNDLSIEDGLATEVAEKTTKKKSADGDEPAVDSVSCAVLSPREKFGDDVLMGAISKDNESAENNDISVQEILKISDEETLNHENSITIDDLIDLENGDKAAELVKIDQEKDVAPTLEPADGHVTLTDAVNESVEVPGEQQVDVAAENCVILVGEKLDELLSGPIEKDNEEGEGSKLAPSSGTYVQSTEVGANCGLATGSAPEKKKKRKLQPTGPALEKKKKRKKSSKESKRSKTDSQLQPTGPALEKKKKGKKRSKDSKSSTKVEMTASQSEPYMSNNESPTLDVA